ncbi:MAG: ATP-dependent zinc protease [Proteobacteria bacterium]|nr:ATP-dependent zinc protease [Pseudomonadota bacterium]
MNKTVNHKNKIAPPKTLVGWREWIELPELGIQKIKAKIDTGAKTSTLHAFDVQPFKQKGRDKVRFDIHPLQRNTRIVVSCIADIIDRRWVTDSGGHKELRYVIETMLVLGDASWKIEMTLTNRDNMQFRMLLGRAAMRKRLIVNPTASFIIGKK